MSAKPRILMAIGNFHPCRGGMENQAFALARSLAARRIQVSVLTQHRNDSPAEETIDGVKIFRRIRPWPIGPVWGYMYLRQCLREFRALAPTYDIIHCHQVYLHTVAGMRIAPAFEKKVVCKVVCGGEYNDFLRLSRIRGGSRLVRESRQTDRMIVLNEEIRDEVQDWSFPPEKIVKIPNMIDTEAFSPGETERSDSDLVYIGQLQPRKKLDVLLKAF